jgi:hypothetical protein
MKAIHYDPRSPLVRAVQPAYLLARDALFQRPFPIRRWLSLGFILLLESLTVAVGTQSILSADAFSPIEWMRNTVREVSGLLQWSVDNMIFAALLAVIVIPIVLAVGTLLFWLSSRGQVMLVRSVIERDFRIGGLWIRSIPQSRQVFRFLVAFDGAFVLVIFAILLLLIVQSLSLSDGARVVFWTMLRTVYPILLLAMPLGLVFWLVNVFLRDMIIPLMVRYDLTIMEAWSRLADIARTNFMTLIGYILVRTAIMIIIFYSVYVVGFLTVFIGLLPYVSQVLLGPLHLFDRAYSLYVLEFMVPDFKLMRPPSPAAPPPLPAAAVA